MTIDELQSMADHKLIDQLWAEEAESRIDAFQRDEFSAKPAHEVFNSLTKGRY
jgi:hypothetical protein